MGSNAENSIHTYIVLVVTQAYNPVPEIHGIFYHHVTVNLFFCRFAHCLPKYKMKYKKNNKTHRILFRLLISVFTKWIIIPTDISTILLQYYNYITIDYFFYTSRINWRGITHTSHVSLQCTSESSYSVWFLCHHQCNKGAEIEALKVAESIT